MDTASSPFANSVTTLAELVVLNYLALHGEEAMFGTVLNNPELGTGAQSRRTSRSIESFDGKDTKRRTRDAADAASPMLAALAPLLSCPACRSELDELALAATP